MKPQQSKSYKAMAELVRNDGKVKTIKVQHQREEGLKRIEGTAAVAEKKETADLIYPFETDIKPQEEPFTQQLPGGAVVVDIFAKAKAEQERKKGTWEADLKYNQYGELEASIDNMVLIMRNDPRLNGLRLNAMSDEVEINCNLPWKRTDKPPIWDTMDNSQLLYYLKVAYGATFKKYDFQNAFNVIIDDNRYNPLVKYIKSLPRWDECPRIETLFVDYLGAEDNIYTRQVARKMMCAMVARALEPGTKYDEMVVLQGKPGIGKSTLFKRIGGGDDYYSDSFDMACTNDKSGGEMLQPFWIVEVGEMQGMKKAEINRIKNFVSRTSDDYRPPYGTAVVKHPRHTIIVGTTNAENGYLRDTTGNRKYWPVKCNGNGKYKPWDLDDETRDQMFAEALYWWKNGEKLMLSAEAIQIAEDEQRDAMVEDERQGILEDFLQVEVPIDFDEWEMQRRIEYFDSENHGNLVYNGFTTYDAKNYPGEKHLREHISVLEIAVECFEMNINKKDQMLLQDIRQMMARIGGWTQDGTRMRSKAYGRQRVYIKQ